MVTKMPVPHATAEDIPHGYNEVSLNSANFIQLLWIDQCDVYVLQIRILTTWVVFYWTIILWWAKYMFRWYFVHNAPEPLFNIKTVSQDMRISSTNIWRSLDLLIYIMGICTLVRWHLYIEMVTRILDNFGICENNRSRWILYSVLNNVGRTKCMFMFLLSVHYILKRHISGSCFVVFRAPI